MFLWGLVIVVMLYLPVGSVRCWMHNLLWMNPAAEQEILKVELELSIVSPFSVNPSPQSSAQSQQKVCNWHLFYLQLLNLEGRQPNIPEQPYQSELSTSQTSPLDTIWDYLLRYLTGYVSCFFGKICPSALFFCFATLLWDLAKRTPGTIVATKERAQVPNIGPQQTSYKRNSRTVGRVPNYAFFSPLKVESWKKHGELWKVWKMSNCFFLTSDDKKPRIPPNHWAYCSWCFCFELQKRKQWCRREFLWR